MTLQEGSPSSHSLGVTQTGYLRCAARCVAGQSFFLLSCKPLTSGIHLCAGSQRERSNEGFDAVFKLLSPGEPRLRLDHEPAACSLSPPPSGRHKHGGKPLRHPEHPAWVAGGRREEQLIAARSGFSTPSPLPQPPVTPNPGLGNKNF